MSYTKDEKDWLGRDRKGHYDDNGNKIGTSKQEKDWLGKERTANFDSQGNKIGISKEEKDWLGNDKTVHYDADGNKSGSSKSEKDWMGEDIIQHYDEKGNKSGQSKYEKDWLGRRVLKHSKTSSSGNSAIGYLILFAIVVIVVLGTFSFPYKLIDSELQPFKLGWLENRNVWIFCASIWILIITLFSTLKSLFADKEGVKANEYIVSNNIITTLLLIASSAITAAFIIKAKFPEEFLTWGISVMSILLLIYGLLFFKTSKVLHTAITFVVFAFGAIFYLNQEPSLSNFSESITVAPIINPESNITVTNNELKNDINSSEEANRIFKEVVRLDPIKCIKDTIENKECIICLANNSEAKKSNEYSVNPEIFFYKLSLNEANWKIEKQSQIYNEEYTRFSIPNDLEIVYIDNDPYLYFIYQSSMMGNAINDISLNFTLLSLIDYKLTTHFYTGEPIYDKNDKLDKIKVDVEGIDDSIDSSDLSKYLEEKVRNSNLVEFSGSIVYDNEVSDEDSAELNNSTKITKPEENNFDEQDLDTKYSIGNYVTNGKEDGRAYFHNEPFPSTIRRAYLVTGEKVHINKILNGFGFTEFINLEGKKSIGWIDMTELNLTQ
jgi:hypothetical protein